MKVFGFKRHLVPRVSYFHCVIYISLFDDTFLLVSMVGWVIIFILVLAEFRNFITPKYNELMIVDTTLGEQLRVNINITFHALTCREAHLDVMDVAGDNQLNVEHLMMKQRLTPDGRPIGKMGIELIGEIDVSNSLLLFLTLYLLDVV
jgi:hypothetical protein